ncbi:MAG TPA: hypothetical protein VI454_11445 [Verrucomicrobiae bacterium]|jgi:hypothetical protein
MNFVLALLAYLAFAVLIGAGLLLAVCGKGLVLFVFAVAAFIAMFSWAGCLSSHG